MGSIKRTTRGFTLIEILIVIGIIAILAAIVIVAINPSRQFAQARNSQRTSNINAILNAIGQNLADNKGTFNCGASITTASSTIGTSGKDIAPCLVPVYLPVMVMDPDNGTAVDTGYTIAMDASGRFTVCAPRADEAALGHPGAICVIR